ncbi:MAG: PLDc N-terminal domain-containing protein [Chthoniobacterales bacterium]
MIAPLLAFGLPTVPEMLILIVPFAIVWIMAIISAARNPYLQGKEKTVWLLIIIFLQIVGAVIYFIAAPRDTRRK